MWLYESGFPKSLDVSKAIDKNEGHWRGKAGETTTSNGAMSGPNYERTPKGDPITPEAQQWQGWGTALKPAHEPIVVARKPLTGTVASNVLEWGTGALNIDASRVGTDGGCSGAGSGPSNGIYGEGLNGTFAQPVEGLGRWPANVIHDGSDEVLAGFPTTKAATSRSDRSDRSPFTSGQSELKSDPVYQDGGGSAARFFYCAKASKSERNAGLEGLPEKQSRTTYDKAVRDATGNDSGHARANFHPTVKPIDLMRQLVEMSTERGDLVLDPFLGSGTTAVAATLEKRRWVGCEMTEDYWAIIEARTEWADAEILNAHPTLFEL
jgi:site-specific DNA-methyltransferase (adenine-specific)